MLNTLPMAKPSGFTLIEMMIVVAIVVLATTLGLPSYRTWVQNTQIYNAAESAQNGLQKAQAEAVKLNSNVEFVLAANSPWKIQLAGSAVIESSTMEGSKNVTHTATPTNATTITFNNLGGVGVPPNTPFNTDGSAPLRQIEFDSAVLTGSRKLRVTIGINGVGSNIRMCDPNLATGTSPRAC